MLVWTSNLGGNPQTLEVGGNTSTPTSLRVCFFEEAEGQKAEVGGNTAAQYSLFEWALGTPHAWAVAPSRFAPFFSSPKPPGGLGLVLSVIPSAFDLVHTARVVEGDDSRDR